MVFGGVLKGGARPNFYFATWRASHVGPSSLLDCRYVAFQRTGMLTLEYWGFQSIRSQYQILHLRGIRPPNGSVAFDESKRYGMGCQCLQEQWNLFIYQLYGWNIGR